jgi:hypothetical protein
MAVNHRGKKFYNIGPWQQIGQSDQMFDQLEIQPLRYLCSLCVHIIRDKIKKKFYDFDTWDLLLPVGVGVNLVLKIQRKRHK